MDQTPIPGEMSAEALISETFFVFSNDEFLFQVMKTMIQRFFHLSRSECHQGLVRQVRERMSSLDVLVILRIHVCVMNTPNAFQHQTTAQSL